MLPTADPDRRAGVNLDEPNAASIAISKSLNAPPPASLPSCPGQRCRRAGVDAHRLPLTLDELGGRIPAYGAVPMQALAVESWVTLLDLLPERLELTGTKKGGGPFAGLSSG